MRTLGLLGGMSWESTVPYYRVINEAVRARHGGHRSAPLVMVSVDFEPIARLQAVGDWDEAGRLLGVAGRTLADAGAERIVLCTNTMHRVADAIEHAAGVPLLHIADATGAAIGAASIRRVALLGTRFTMEQPFYRERLAERFGLDVLVPEPDERDTVHRVIYDELVKGRVLDASRAAYRDVIGRLVTRGAEGIVLGCTEIGLLIGPGDAPVPTFDTTAIHAHAAAEWAMSG